MASDSLRKVSWLRNAAINFTVFAIVGLVVLAVTALAGHLTRSDVSGTALIVVLLTIGAIWQHAYKVREP